MRTKTLGINVRVTAEEKEKLQNNAKLCGLSLSDYMRKLGLGSEVEAAQSRKDYLVFRRIEDLKGQISTLTEKEIIRKLEQRQIGL